MDEQDLDLGFDGMGFDGMDFNDLDGDFDAEADTEIFYWALKRALERTPTEAPQPPQ